MTVVSASAACSGVPMTRSELNSPTASPAQRNRPSGTRRGSPHIKHHAGDGDRSPSRLAGTATENLRFPRERLLRMPGSTMTRGRRVSRDIDTNRVAFCGDGKHQPPRGCLTLLNTSPAPSPENASRLPSRTARASLGAGAVRHSFTVTDFDRLPFAGLPAHPSTHHKRPPAPSGCRLPQVYARVHPGVPVDGRVNLVCSFGHLRFDVTQAGRSIVIRYRTTA
jgi:hypothetical protein